MVQFNHQTLLNNFIMICNENSLVMDIGLLANVSRELKDRICADTFQKLQKRTNRELFTVDCEVDRVLRNESYIRSRLYSAIDACQLDYKRSMKIRNILWNKKLLSSLNQKTQKPLDESFRLRKTKSKPTYDSFCNSQHMQNYPSNTVVQSASPSLTSDQQLTVNMKSGQKLNTSRDFKLEKNDFFLSNYNTRYKSESVITRPKEQGNFLTQWRSESDPLSWRDIQFTTIDSEARGKSRNRLCGAFNATSFQLIYAQ
ncbi:hypothetical protein MS3_00003911 [Schistosoma haematobium]|uniref:Uncharacterized protein n=1 Tax=Schistosoma haematobium TaxID=6185 RepID=A0A922LRE9_SCHHA|nr:hypothetical protein MS3_00003911 [Schistosoma haematobium]KAH9591745.1 hypothetical protein MS3_00003911 [Schistosoma haematobium]CAH8672853.1 unnamed protein product [Schistosoma haematobium]CAH8677040.1 unnamed protein product [Schistosoma haematobium]